MEIDSFKNWIGILVFKVSTIEFGCNITRVHFLPSVKQKLTSEGCIIFKEKEIPLYYMGDLLNIKSTSKNKNKDILIFESNESPFGFGVDEVKEVLPLDEKIFENEIMTEKVADNKFLLGKIYFEGRTILLPDFDKIVDDIKSKEYASF